MNRKWLYISLASCLLTLLFVPGCSKVPGISGASPIVKPNILRQAELGGKWAMQQMEIDVAAGKEVKILLKLADKDQVDGYFYIENGDNIEFQIMADTLVYEPKGDNPKAPGRVTSDRFTFTASKALGSTYTLVFHNPDEASKKTKISVFTEVVYPVTGSIFTEIELKSNNKEQ